LIVDPAVARLTADWIDFRGEVIDPLPESEPVGETKIIADKETWEKPVAAIKKAIGDFIAKFKGREEGRNKNRSNRGLEDS
jgi:hypothetical protein